MFQKTEPQEEGMTVLFEHAAPKISERKDTGGKRNSDDKSVCTAYANASREHNLDQKLVWVVLVVLVLPIHALDSPPCYLVGILK